MREAPIMPTTRTETLTCRLAPEVKAALRAAAAREHRSLANMLEVMVLRYARAERRVRDGRAGLRATLRYARAERSADNGASPRR
jgi:uncharacterized protein (DUF1778 family)